MRVAAGAVPHRDFYANYGPAQFYILAGLFDVFGQTVLVERLYDVAVKTGIVCLVYVIGPRLMRRQFATLVAGVCMFFLWRIGVCGLSNIGPPYSLSCFRCLPFLPSSTAAILH